MQKTAVIVIIAAEMIKKSSSVRSADLRERDRRRRFAIDHRVQRRVSVCPCDQTERKRKTKTMSMKLKTARAAAC